MKRLQINKYYLVLVCLSVLLIQCKKDPDLSPDTTPVATTPIPVLASTTPYTLNIPSGFPNRLNIQADNRLTVEGIALGKRLFYDSILSGDNTLSCAGCHSPEFAFSDNKIVSKGIDGIFGDRNSPAIMNIAWNNSFFWDGRAATPEEQALGPVPNEIEMHLPWDEAVLKLQATSYYPQLFNKAFETDTITKELVAKAIAQFERTLISANSLYDKWLVGQYAFTASEERGYNLFFTEGADCFHCHSTSLFTDNRFHNNGLDAFPQDNGFGAITEDANDNGKFKSPTLRNIEATGPYMHDGRFATLEDVIDFYSDGLQSSVTIDPLMQYVGAGGARLDSLEKVDLLAFLKTLTDPEFLNNPDFRQ